MSPSKLKVAVIGPGMIGTDLLYKLKRSSSLEVAFVVGRDIKGSSLQRAQSMGFNICGGGIDGLLDHSHEFDLVFDATNAISHIKHWKRLQHLDKKVIDLTPSKIGHMVVPTESCDADFDHSNINLISCGGQTAVPVLSAVAKSITNIDYIEVITTASSPSVGRATRLNLDEYIYTTENAIQHFTKIKKVKALVNISGANPPVPFRVAMTILHNDPTPAKAEQAVKNAVRKVQQYVPGYKLYNSNFTMKNRIFISLEVEGRGDFLPKYSGNLDIINEAGIFIAMKYAAIRSKLRPTS